MSIPDIFEEQQESQCGWSKDSDRNSGKKKLGQRENEAGVQGCVGLCKSNGVIIFVSLIKYTL